VDAVRRLFCADVATWSAATIAFFFDVNLRANASSSTPTPRARDLPHLVYALLPTQKQLSNRESKVLSASPNVPLGRLVLDSRRGDG
jgi:hypothetical protein